MSDTESLHIELTERQRRRLDEIKAECSGEGIGSLPEPSDQEMMKSLLDTWDAVGDGMYSDDEGDMRKSGTIEHPVDAFELSRWFNKALLEAMMDQFGGDLHVEARINTRSLGVEMEDE